MKSAIFILVPIVTTFVIDPSYAIHVAQDRFWHEEIFISGGSDDSSSKVLYPRFKSCVAPLKPVAVKKIERAADWEAQWSTFFGLYFFEHGHQFNFWDKERDDQATHDSESDEETISVSFFVLAFIVYIFMWIFLTPIIGCLVFLFYASIWRIITCPLLRVCLRKFWVWNERRKIKTNILLSSGDNSKAVRMRNRVPTFLRKHKDEEYPDELIISGYEGEGELHNYSDSSDGFEVEYFTSKPDEGTETKKKRAKKPAAKKETLVKVDPRGSKMHIRPTLSSKRQSSRPKMSLL